MSVTVSECIESLSEAKSILGHSPTSDEYEELGLSPSCTTILRVVGSWNEAKKLAGMERHKHCEINHNYFKRIDTDEKAYWLGFLYGDGSLTRNTNGTTVLQVYLADRDVDHLRQFSADVGSGYKLSHGQETSQGNFRCHTSISDARFCHHLSEKGLGPDGKDTIPSVDNLLRPSFLRGYFDADGYCGYHIGSTNQTKFQWEIVSTNKQRIYAFRDWLLDMGITGAKIRSRTSTEAWDIRIGRQNDLVTLYETCWPVDCEVRCMQRKQNSVRDLYSMFQ